MRELTIFETRLHAIHKFGESYNNKIIPNQIQSQRRTTTRTRVSEHYQLETNGYTVLLSIWDTPSLQGQLSAQGKGFIET